MKTPKEYLNKISEEKGFTNFMKAFWEGCLDDVESIAIEAMQEYGKQIAEAQRENTSLRVPGYMVYKEYREDLHEHLMTSPLVTDNI